MTNRNLVVSPFWFCFIFVFAFGLVCHFILPAIFPDSFTYGITNFLVDPQTFHKIAADLASRPYSEFSLRPQGQFPAFVLALIYKLTGIHKPYMFLPLLAFFAALTTHYITNCLYEFKVHGRWWPLILGVLLTFTPTSLSWMVYPHKDAFIVPGFVLIFFSLIRSLSNTRNVANFFVFLAGTLLVYFNKPYFVEILVISNALLLPCMVIKLIKIKKLEWGMVFPVFTLSALLLLVSLNRAYIFRSITYIESKSSEQLESPEVAVTTPENVSKVTESFNESKKKNLLEKMFLTLAFKREEFLSTRGHAATNFLPDVHLRNTSEVFLFFPKAIQLSVLEPLPWRVNEKGGVRSILVNLVKVEMIITYLALIAISFSFFTKYDERLLLCIVLSLPFLIILGYAVPNIGSINRYRFPFLIFIKIAGFASLWNSSRLTWPGKLLMWVDPPEIPREKKKILFLVPDDATFLIQRLVMALGAKKAGYDVHVASEDSGASKKIQELGFTFHRLDLNRGGLNPFADFVPFIKLIFFLAKERPDILQCVSIKPVLYGATAGTIVGLKRIVCLINGLGYAFDGNGFKGKLIKRIALGLYRNALALPGIRVIFQNPDDRDYFVTNRLVDAHKTLIIRGSGVDMIKFSPTQLPKNEVPVVLFVGRLLWNKGIKELVEASRVLKTYLKFRLVIVGAPDDKNPEAVPRSYLEKLHSDGIIDWVGRQTDMPKFYREADIICLPTQYKEGLPLTLLEAASTGRPLVATDVPGCREIVRNGENGFLVRPKDIDSLKMAIEKLLVNSELRAEFGKRSSEIVANEFSGEIIQDQLISVYQSLLNDSVHLSDNLKTCLTTSSAY